jgi:hypothetical protein
MNMIISSTDFMYSGVLYFRDSGNGRCYRLTEPAGRRSRAARKGLLTSRRVSLTHFTECLAACRQALERRTA